MWPPLPDRPAQARAFAPVETLEATIDLPLAKETKSCMANPEVVRDLPCMANSSDDDDLLDDVAGGKSTGVTEIGKGWRLETNADGRMRWRWQVKDDAGNPITYVKPDGETGYKRGSKYVGITQRDKAKEHDRKRIKGKHKPRRSRKARG